ncbi:LLM class flavin-dependent oxidoreductase [Roseiarcaceae bacterium H3SJ34-1]|uniref:LLM class flavin-dependent oxidoreductase n=1 Tax=Terripilifer ovatus TaxID=3032367 RepID=UPI003AB94211|nr:LLM class flavin-dependent oxidoreductase [Roseiarcaceae bacterium H3SJ34-1]
MLTFGNFDHVDADDQPLATFYEERLKLVEQLDRLGFHGYHTAEHHFTPLGLAASPGIYLSAVAQRTRRLRFGPLVYTLPLYHPLRLAEEICMLDQMSGGRLDVGIGRGISPIEAALYGEPSDVTTSRQVHQETLEIIQQALQNEQVNFNGTFRQASDVQMQLTPLQKPHPPFWMGVATEESAETAARAGYSFIASAPAADVGSFNRRYVETWDAVHPEKPMTTKRGLALFVVVADTDAEAQAIAARAYRVWYRSFNYLYRQHGRSPVKGERATEFSEVIAETRGIAGSPATVRHYLQERIDEAQCNYLVGHFFFGNLTFAESSRSIDLFASEVMPALVEPREMQALSI